MESSLPLVRKAGFLYCCMSVYQWPHSLLTQRVSVARLMPSVKRLDSRVAYGGNRGRSFSLEAKSLELPMQVHDSRSGRCHDTTSCRPSADASWHGYHDGLSS